MVRHQAHWLALVLASIALSVFSYKFFVLHLPLKPDITVDVWDMEVQLTFQGQKMPAKVRLHLPQTQDRFEVVDEHFISGNYGLAIQQFATNRRATWTVRSASGKQYLLYKATVRPALQTQPDLPIKKPKIVEPDYTRAQLVAATHIMNSVRKRSADEETLVSLLLAELAHHNQDENILLLLDKDNSIANRAMVAVNVLAVGGIAAHAVHGIELGPLTRDARRVHWLEVFYKDNWHAFNLLDGSQQLPDNYLAWWRNDKPLATLEGGENLYTKISISVNPQVALQQHQLAGQNGQSKFLEYSLLSLPIEIQSVYHVILMVPIGVFFLALMRTVVGVKTFGTFMPILIALSFRETQLAWGIGLFVLVVGTGLMIRFYFDRLKLLLVPRLASVLIVVIILMGLISIISYKLGLPRGLSVALFPMVIMTMTIERMSIVWEERGAREAMQQGMGSLFVAAIAYLLMNIEELRHFIFVYPETLLFILALVMLLGRYSGYRLTELVRFKALGAKQ